MKEDRGGLVDLTPGDPLVIKLKLGGKGKEVEFLVDMGAAYLSLNKTLAPMGNDYVTLRGATDQSEKAYFFKPSKYRLGKQWNILKFLYLPSSLRHLLGRDLLEQLQVTIKFNN